MTSPQPNTPRPAVPTPRPQPVRPVPPPRPTRTPTRVTPHAGESRAKFVARLVAAAPPLTEQQRARLWPVLAPLRDREKRTA